MPIKPPALPLCFSGPSNKHRLALSQSPFPLLFDGVGTVRSHLCRAVCLYPPVKGLRVITGHRTVLPRGLEALRSRRHRRVDLRRGPWVRGALIRSRTETTCRTLETKEFLHQPLKAFPVRCGSPSLQPWTPRRCFTALIPGDGNGSDTPRR